MIEELKQNIERERQIVHEVLDFYNRLEYLEVMVSTGMIVDLREKKLIEGSILSLLSQLKIINNALPEVVNNISFYNKINESQSDKTAKGDLTKVKYKDPNKGQELNLAIKKREENKFLKSLSIHSTNVKKIEKKDKTNSLESQFRGYISLSNRLFREYSGSLVEKGYFQSMRNDLRKITSPLIIGSYLSVMFFSVIAAAGAGLILGILFFILFGIWAALGVLVALPLIIFLAFLVYPSSTRKGLEKNINQELPFLTIYISAIATSGIEPSKIFTIVASSKDYPFTQREIRKLTNYLNFYGYDLVSALRLLAKNNPSDRLAQLFDGLSTTITSGGELTDFLNKHSETLLFDYRLEREKYTRVTETLMNIYISVVIAAPMIMLVLFILMGLTSFGQGILNTNVVGILVVMVIGLLNVFFLVFLNIKQPKF